MQYEVIRHDYDETGGPALADATELNLISEVDERTGASVRQHEGVGAIPIELGAMLRRQQAESATRQPRSIAPDVYTRTAVSLGECRDV